MDVVLPVTAFIKKGLRECKKNMNRERKTGNGKLRAGKRLNRFTKSIPRKGVSLHLFLVQNRDEQSDRIHWLCCIGTRIDFVPDEKHPDTAAGQYARLCFFYYLRTPPGILSHHRNKCCDRSDQYVFSSQENSGLTFLNGAS